MARGFFDMVNNYQQGGYGAFQNPSYTPEQLAQMYAMANQSGPQQYSTQQERLGANTVGFLGALVGKLMKKPPKKEDQAEKVARAEMSNRAAELAKEGMPIEKAYEQAALELFGSTAGMTKAGPYMEKARAAAIDATAQARNFGDGGGKPSAATKKVEFINPETKETLWIDLKNEVPPKGYIPVDQSKQTQTITDPSNPEYEYVLERDERTNQWGYATDEEGNKLRRKKGGVNVSITNNPLDPRTEGQQGAAFDRAVLGNTAFQSANEILTELVSISDELPWSPGNIVASVSVMSNKIRGVREALEQLSNIPENKSEKYFADGNMTYYELLNPSKYTKTLKAFETLAGAGQTTERLNATMIELAYMLAVAEEPSARGISDNDIERRLATLGKQAGTKATFQEILEDVRRRLAIKFKAKVDNDPIWKETGLDKRAYEMIDTYSKQSPTRAPTAPGTPDFRSEIKPLRPGR